ncbi:hypothetical protein Cyrtocomes_00553 [Candidatus Cyrtobacter comes]|uniref:HPt domain-containing protein n=1 Tax=Candidatus Cyrtobacter comes TaxID=675776 RepID=A0ABU5L7S7_9RICK|nr:hypothetical protein [Candidatus Cyrtobacter comes]MDZ5762182.1 hypothetical protein [Candidatus Cyrtobacter comes]
MQKAGKLMTVDYVDVLKGMYEKFQSLLPEIEAVYDGHGAEDRDTVQKFFHSLKIALSFNKEGKYYSIRSYLGINILNTLTNNMWTTTDATLLNVIDIIPGKDNGLEDADDILDILQYYTALTGRYASKDDLDDKKKKLDGLKLKLPELINSIQSRVRMDNSPQQQREGQASGLHVTSVAPPLQAAPQNPPQPASSRATQVSTSRQPAAALARPQPTIQPAPKPSSLQSPGTSPGSSIPGSSIPGSSIPGSSPSSNPQRLLDIVRSIFNWISERVTRVFVRLGIVSKNVDIKKSIDELRKNIGASIDVSGQKVTNGTGIDKILIKHLDKLEPLLKNNPNSNKIRPINNQLRNVTEKAKDLLEKRKAFAILLNKVVMDSDEVKDVFNSQQESEKAYHEAVDSLILKIHELTVEIRGERSNIKDEVAAKIEQINAYITQDRDTRVNGAGQGGVNTIETRIKTLQNFSDAQLKSGDIVKILGGLADTMKELKDARIALAKANSGDMTKLQDDVSKYDGEYNTHMTALDKFIREVATTQKQAVSPNVGQQKDWGGTVSERKSSNIGGSNVGKS